MEDSHILKEVLNALNDHSKQINKRFDEMEERFELRFEEMDKRFEEVDKRFDNLDKKVDGIRVDLSETQETTNFLLIKAARQDKKIHNMH